MTKKVLLGYSGSYAFGVITFYKMQALKEKLKKNPKDKKAKQELKRIEKQRSESISPVYVSKEQYKKLKEHKELGYYSAWM